MLKSKIIIYISDDEAQDVFDRIKPLLTATGKDIGDLNDANEEHPHPYYDVDVVSNDPVDFKFETVLRSNKVTVYGSVPTFIVQYNQGREDANMSTLEWLSERQVDLLV